MKYKLLFGALAVASAVVGVVLFGSVASADHEDGSVSTANPSGDIADIYAWRTEDGKLALIQTVVGEFSDDVQYVLHVGRSATALTNPDAWTDIICTFAGKTVSCWAGETDFVSGDASALTGIGDATFRVHTGQHADPFFFYEAGLGQAVDTMIQTLDQFPLDPAGCPQLDANSSFVLTGMLDGSNQGPATNTYESANVSAIVIEIDPSLIAGTGQFFGIWGSTHVAN